MDALQGHKDETLRYKRVMPSAAKHLATACGVILSAAKDLEPKCGLLAFCVFAFVVGCERGSTLKQLPSSGSVGAHSAETYRQHWDKLVEQARREKWTRIETDLPIGEAELTSLTGMTNLRELALPKAAASDQSLDAIASLSSLEVLILGDTTISDDGLAKLGRLHSLRDLNLNECRVTDRGLAQLAELPLLELLRLGKSEITDDGLASAGRISTLRFLILQNARITGRGFKHLHGLKHLESLYLQGNPLTGEGVADLRRALPNLHPDW
jgi:hypothetical protein